MVKKYLGLEEAARILGIRTDELNRVRERGELRGFADRGTWKFRAEDVEEYARSREADSAPDVPMILDDDDDAPLEVRTRSLTDDTPTDVRLGDDDAADLYDGGSDSDVRLILDESLVGDAGDSEPDIALAGSDSDSDVRLVDEKAESDSDVMLVGSDSESDVTLANDTGRPVGASSDSDVKLMGNRDLSDTGSDSDVRLIGDERNVGTDPDVKLVDDDEDEGLTLAEADSGISLESADSGIALADADSGLTFELPDDSGIALDGGDEPGRGTVPMNLGKRPKSQDGTEADVAMFEDEEEGGEYALAMDDEDSVDATDTNVILLEDDDDQDYAPAASQSALDDAMSDDMDVLASSELEEVDEFAFDDDLDMVEDVVGEDDELEELDVFAADEDFDEKFQTGESHAEFAAPVRTVAAPEADWDGLTVGLLVGSTGLLLVCGILMFELVRTMWAFNEPTTAGGMLIESIGGLL